MTEQIEKPGAQTQSLLTHSCEILRADFNAVSFDRHFHDTFSIGFVTSGLNAFSYRGRRVEVPAGAVCIADPGEVHDGGLMRKPWSYVNIFVPAELFQVINSEDGTGGELAFRSGGITHKESCVRIFKLFEALFAGNSDQARIDELAILAFGHLLRHHAINCPQTVTHPKMGPIAELAIEIMRDYQGKEVSLALLSTETGVSRYSVIRAVSSSIGITPVAYMTQLRIERAKRLIWKGMPIAEAALEAGFSDQSHLTRAMKRRLGITPGQLKLIP